jgi:hypothetical protein
MMKLEEATNLSLPTTTDEIRSTVNLLMYQLFDRRDETISHNVTLPDSGEIVQTFEPYQFAPETLNIILTGEGDVVHIRVSADTL